MHDDIPDETSICSSIKHKADLILHVDGLESGVSRDVHGVVSIGALMCAY